LPAVSLLAHLAAGIRGRNKPQAANHLIKTGQSASTPRPVDEGPRLQRAVLLGDSVFSVSKGASSRAQDGSAKIVALSHEGKSPQEIADDVGTSRLDVFRYLPRILSRDKRSRLGIPT
jgi:hypothetical protein